MGISWEVCPVTFRFGVRIDPDVSMGHFVTDDRTPDGLGGESPFLGPGDAAGQKPVLGLRLHVPNPSFMFLGYDERVPW